MTEKNYKETLNLPKTAFPMKADLVQARAGAARQMGGGRAVRAHPRGARGCAALCAARRAAICQWRCPHGHGAQQGAQGHRGKIAVDAGAARAVRAGVGLPWAADRVQGGEGIARALAAGGRASAPRNTRASTSASSATQFKRLGVLGDWEHPYLTLDPGYEAEIIRAFAGFVEAGLVYQSKKPVYWSTGAQTALAEAEVEYADREDPGDFREIPARVRAARRAGEHGHLDDHAVDAARQMSASPCIRSTGMWRRNSAIARRGNSRRSSSRRRWCRRLRRPTPWDTRGGAADVFIPRLRAGRRAGAASLSRPHVEA